jgi:hypothetical protein
MKTDLREETEQEVLAPAVAFDSQTLATLQKSEIDQQIVTAKKFPRALTKLLATAAQLATQDPETADECIYALPRGGKTIEGPSVRFAEIMAYSWGNCRCGARVISEDEEFVTAMGSFFDMEQNVHIGYEVKRRITNSKGVRYNSDMIGTTSNAACSIALRNAILRGIPKAIWRKVYVQARQAVAGDIKTLVERRATMLKQFQLLGAQPAQVFALLEVKGIEDITLDHLVTLRGVFNAIREGDTTVERAFAPKETQDTRLADKSKANLEEIKQRYTNEKGEAIEIGPLRSAPKPPTVAETDPAYAEKLRGEAERQKAAVAEKFGPSQPPSGSGEPSETAPAAAEPSASAAPENVQEPMTPAPAGNTGAEASASPEGAGAPSRFTADDAKDGEIVEDFLPAETSNSPALDFGNTPRGKTRKR